MPFRRVYLGYSTTPERESEEILEAEAKLLLRAAAPNIKESEVAEIARDLWFEVGNPAGYLTSHETSLGGRPIDAVRKYGTLDILRTLLDDRRYGVFS